MRILITIAHYFAPTSQPRYGSQDSNALSSRLKALCGNIAYLHQLFGQSQKIIDLERRVAFPVNQPQGHLLDVIVCTTGNNHLLNQVSLPTDYYQHHTTQAEPLLLGFECQAVLRDCLGQYDYYCFLEDDLILHDPWLFVKLNWFTKQFGDLNVLQPNRYEVSIDKLIAKVYIDGDLALRVTAPFQNVQEHRQLSGEVLEISVTFRRALNPHSGCYFLNSNQMNYWVEQPYFLDRDTSFVGPLESAATLGIMRTFRVYKTILEQAGFLEIQHFGHNYLRLISQQVEVVTS